LGQVAVASFANVQGLVSAGSNNYQATLLLDRPLSEWPGLVAGVQLVGGSVEESNVDIATEFGEALIVRSRLIRQMRNRLPPSHVGVSSDHCNAPVRS